MSEIAIKVENLSKVYKLYDKPIDRMKESLHPLRKRYHKDFYALRDISFEIKKGETIGIIGKNGSGKSTLLKILAGVLTPSSGNVQVNGKVSALLELGAGFNPEFTGIENVYFQGSIMGYTREQMDAKIDEILSFADIGDFVYQPVKMYSSGMFARLAFAVAMSVDPDILIIDEALAVGDAQFVRKCYERMDNFRREGKTIIIVTHDILVIKSFTERAIIINSGSKYFDGSSLDASIHYMQLLFPKEFNETVEAENAFIPQANDQYVLSINTDFSDKYWGIGGGKVSVINVYGLTEPNVIRGGDELIFELFYEWNQSFINEQIVKNRLLPNIIVGIALYNQLNINLTACNTYEAGELIDPYEKSKGRVKFKVKFPNLTGGDYYISPAIAIGNQDNNIQLKWSEVVVNLKCIPNKKYIFGLMYFDTSITEID